MRKNIDMGVYDSVASHDSKRHYYAHHPDSAVELEYNYIELLDRFNELEKKYDDMVDNTIKSSNEMIGNWLHVLINKDMEISGGNMKRELTWLYPTVEPLSGNSSITTCCDGSAGV